MPCSVVSRSANDSSSINSSCSNVAFTTSTNASSTASTTKTASSTTTSTNETSTNRTNHNFAPLNTQDECRRRDYQAGYARCGTIRCSKGKQVTRCASDVASETVLCSCADDRNCFRDVPRFKSIFDLTSLISHIPSPSFRQTQPRRCITVEDASEILQQNRRRLYDAIHVLSGAGVVRVEKIKVKGPDGKIMGKDVTMIHWVNRAAPKTAEHLRLEELDQESKNLDAWLQHCRTARTKLNLKMLHVSKDLLLTKQARNNEAGAALPRHPGRGPSQSESVDLVLAPPPGSVLNVNPPFADTDGYSFQVSVPIGTSSKQKTQSPIPISAYIMEGGKLHNLLPPRPLLSPTSSGTPHIGESQKRSEPFVSLSPPDRRDGSLDESCLDFRPGSPHLAYCSSDLHFQSTASGPGISPTPEATTPALMTPSSPLTPLAVTPLLSSTTSDLWRLLSPEMPLNKAELESHLSNKTGTSSSYLSPTVCQSSNHNVTPRDQSQGVGTGHLPMDLITPAATVSSPPPATVTPPFSRSISELLKLMQPPPPTSLALDGMSPPDKKSATSLDPVFPCDALEQDPLLLAALANMGEL